MNENFMKETPIFPLLTSMALPMVLSMLVNSLYNIIDSFFVARINENAMTALSLVYPVQNLINAAAIGFGIGINAAVAFYLGSGNKEQANTAASRGLLLSGVHGMFITLISLLFTPFFLRMFTSSEEVADMGIQYSAIAFSFSLVIMLDLSFEKIFQSVGAMKVTMASLLCGCIANIILDPLLIWGIGFFPALGIRGAALATGIGQVLSLAVYLIAYGRYPLPVRISRKYLSANREIDIRLYAVGIPAAINLALPSFLISFLNTLLGLYSQSYVVILGIYYKLQTFLYLPANGIVQGMRPIIGYNFGAGEGKRVKKIYDTALYMTGAIMALGTALCLTASRQLISLFTDNPETIQAGKQALRIISAGFLVSAVSVTSSGALEGLGKGTASLIIAVFRYTAIIIPAAYVLCRLFGAAGVWHAFWITEMITAVVASVVYRRAAARK
ncbi:MATE family efflux transporter [Lacrimispora sp. 210928-DFI.3.58]|uniref:MATE family efflux transporter n=1 Tax=Lacrimispora sp. 210928-DFI.3.58 TaxID=2883214 RepID=UPI0015B62F28|nr:MATE family efflux transporter [Lacrimispora sp. 210928-DFI.3.58]MCB7318355.1 MATE family efflux transporter [Lacrimispora sp. 210928-DFI.3.58]